MTEVFIVLFILLTALVVHAHYGWGRALKGWEASSDNWKKSIESRTDILKKWDESIQLCKKLNEKADFWESAYVSAYEKLREHELLMDLDSEIFEANEFVEKMTIKERASRLDDFAVGLMDFATQLRSSNDSSNI